MDTKRIAALTCCVAWGCGEDPRDNDSATASASVSISVSVSASGDDTGGDGTASDDGVSSADDGTKLDVGNTGADSSTGDIDECAGISEMSDVGLQPADIIFVLDNSGSMDFETASVQANMNAFSSQIFLANIDAHVVVISSYPDNDGVCIEPPLGSGGCPADDNNPPGYVHVNDKVGSNDGLQKLIAQHPAWMASMRQTASKHIVIVTDDNSDLSAVDFTTMWAGLDPTYSPFFFHAIAADTDPVTACFNGSSCCAISAAAGTVYQQLVNQTGGVWGDLCSQQFQPIFDQLAMAVVQGSTLACEFAIPAPPDGEEFDPMQVNVEFQDDVGAVLEIGHVESAAECAGVTNGWYYDDPAAPTTIILCPQTCETIQGFTMASLSVQFGCATKPAG